MKRSAILAVVAAALLALASAYHLGDEDELHCWSNKSGKEIACPEGVTMVWEPPVKEVVINTDNAFTAGQYFTDEFLEINNLTNVEGPIVPHANFHVCKDVIGFCTPYITASCGAPDTFTSTPAIKGGAGEMTQTFSLPAAGKWIALWHIKVADYSIAAARFMTALENNKCDIGWTEVQDPNIEGATICTPCLAGTKGTEERTCEPCPIGFHSPRASYEDSETGVKVPAQCIECDTLGPKFFSDEPGAYECKECPANSARGIGTKGFNVDECLCEAGYWQPELLERGAACVACQEPGGVCPGGLTTGSNRNPYNAEGWWGDDSEVTGVFLECFSGPEWCHENFQCDSKHTGRMCSKCADDHFSLGGYCIECASSSARNYAFTIVLIIVVIVLWIFLNTRAVEKYFSIDILLGFFQIYQLVGYFSIRWPSALSTWHAITNFALFEIDFVGPECVGDWDKTTEFVIQLLLSPMVLVAVLALYGFQVVHARSIYPWYRESLHWKRSIFDLPVTKKQLAYTWDVLVGFFFAFLVETYAALCLKAFESFICEDLPSGDGSLLLAWPEMDCWKGKHYGHVVGSVLAIVVFVIGVPVSLRFVLKRGADESILADKQYFTRFGFLYARYELDYYWWELTMFFRKAAVSAVTIFLREDGLTQCALTIVILIVILAVQAFVQPFRSKALFYLDSLGLLTSILYALAGVLFTADFKHDEITQVVVFVPMCVTIIWTFLQFRDEYIDKKSSVKALKTLAKRLPQALVTSPDAVDPEYAVMIAEIKDAFDQHDTDNTGTLTKGQLTSLLRSFTDLNDLEIDGIFAQCDVSKTGTLDRAEFETLVFVELLHLVRARTARESFVAGRMNVHNSFTKWTNLAGASTHNLKVEKPDVPPVEPGATQSSPRPQAVAESSVLAPLSNGSGAPTRPPVSDASRTLAGQAFRRASTEYVEVATMSGVAPQAFADAIVGVDGDDDVEAPGDADFDQRRTAFKSKMARSRVFSKVNAAMQRRDMKSIYGELATTITSRNLWDWIAQQQDTAALVRFYKLDQILTPHLTDHSMHSAYSNNPLALFHHDLLSKFPFVLDYLVEASDAEIDAFRGLVESLVRFQYRAGKGKRSEGQLANLIHKLDHSALSIWLHSFSEPSERRQLQDLLHDVHGFAQDQDETARCLKVWISS